MIEVLESAKRISETSELVKIDREALVVLSRDWLSTGVKVPAWDDAHHFAGGVAETVAYLLVLDSLNFCFWPTPWKPRWEVRFGSKTLSGYYALAASLKRAVESGVPMTRADFLAEMSKETLTGILGGGGELQLMERRAGILRELGRILLSDYEGDACKLVEAAGGSAVALARLLGSQLDSFRDTAEYKGHEAFFYKRAQIFAADLHGTFRGKDRGALRDMGQLTAFADYKLPQVLRHLGVLRYARDLAGKVDEEVLLNPGGTEEVEIRANTIWAVERIRQELALGGKDLMAFEIDGILWNMGQQDQYRSKPYHKTITIYY
jgi:Queuosine salvage protein